jgi:hypothetical protein
MNSAEENQGYVTEGYRSQDFRYRLTCVRLCRRKLDSLTTRGICQWRLGKKMQRPDSVS